MDGKKFLALLLGTALILVGTVNSFDGFKAQAAHRFFNVREHEAKKENIKEKKKGLESTLQETREKVNNKREQCDSVNKQIMSTQDQISKIKSYIQVLDREISEKNNNISNKQATMQENIEILMKRLVAVYKAGEVHALDLILSAKTFDDFIDKAEIINKISEHDNRLINKLKDDIKVIENEKKDIESKKASVEIEKNKLSSKESELQKLLSENEKLLKEFEGEQAVAQAEIDENDAEYQRIQNEINRYYAEEAERQRRAEEAKRNKNVSSQTNLPVAAPSGKGYVWPVPGYYMRLSSGYMEKRGNTYHKGIDIAGSGIYGKSVVAADSGVIITAYSGCHHDYGKMHSCGCGGGYGNYVIIAHGNGKVSIYGHLSRVCVSKGQRVSQGEELGEVGTTGYSTGPHLHYQTKQNGIDYNPLDEYRK